MRRTTNASVPIPRIPSTTMAATTIKMILSESLPCEDAAGVEGTVAGIAADMGTDVPHFGQNLTPASRFVPQELQKAIAITSSILNACQKDRVESGVYLKSSECPVQRSALTQESRGIVGHAECQQEEQPKDRRNNHDLGQFLAGVLHMHKKQNDEQSLDGGDNQRHDRVK